MKKQKNTTINTQSFTDIVSSHKVREVNPPEKANKNSLTGGYDIDKAKAAQVWFQTAKSAEGTDEFLGVPKQTLDPSMGLGREKLYNGKKKTEK